MRTTKTAITALASGLLLPSLLLEPSQAANLPDPKSAVDASRDGIVSLVGGWAGHAGGGWGGGHMAGGWGRGHMGGAWVRGYMGGGNRFVGHRGGGVPGFSEPSGASSRTMGETATT